MSKKPRFKGEIDACNRDVTAAVVRAGWDQRSQVRREFAFTAGQVRVKGTVATRGVKKRAEYLLFFAPNLGIVKAKGRSALLGGGMLQALEYARALDVPFVFLSNGNGFLFHDLTGASNPEEHVLNFIEYPSPSDLWARYRIWRGICSDVERVVRLSYHSDTSGKLAVAVHHLEVN